jgi:vacuolar protein sorting-associated protein 13A/C
MFEQPLLFFLKRVLQDFVEDGEHLNEKVQVGVWSGFIVLENLVLKNSILSLVDVPISLNYGYIGRLEIKIPWSRLGSEPVTVVIDKVNILVEPKYEWNPGAADRREQAIKQAKLAAAELFANQRFESPGASSKYGDFAKNWFLNAFLGKIIDNIQVTVRDVHIRYEDRLSCPSDFCIGFSFESLLLQSRQANGGLEDVFSPNKSSVIPDSTRNYEKEINIGGADSFYKIIELNHMAVYWNPMVSKGMEACSCSFIGRSPREIQSLMSRTTATRLGTNRPRHHYILQPVNMTALLDMALNVGTGAMKVCLSCISQ